MARTRRRRTAIDRNQRRNRLGRGTAGVQNEDHRRSGETPLRCATSTVVENRLKSGPGMEYNLGSEFERKHLKTVGVRAQLISWFLTY